MLTIKKGAADQSIYFDLMDSASTTGGRKTGLAYNTSGLKAYYVRSQGSATQITLASLAAANSAHADGGFKEVDATNMPGVYRLDLPDAVVAAGVDTVSVTISGATGLVQSSMTIQLVDNVTKDVYDRLGAPAGASIAADLVTIDDFLDAEVAAIKNKTDQLTFGTANRVDAQVYGIENNAVTAASLATDAVTEIADGLLNRDMSAGTDSGSTTVRTLRQAVRFLRNKWAVSGGTLTVYKEDDSTASWSATVATDAAADPIVGNDPAGP